MNPADCLTAVVEVARGMRCTNDGGPIGRLQARDDQLSSGSCVSDCWRSHLQDELCDWWQGGSFPAVEAGSQRTAKHPGPQVGHHRAHQGLRGTSTSSLHCLQLMHDRHAVDPAEPAGSCRRVRATKASGRVKAWGCGRGAVQQSLPQVCCAGRCSTRHDQADAGVHGLSVGWYALHPPVLPYISSTVHE